ncbi:restriction endonuclease subunit S [Bradyrhizobium oligotrophicum]|uniref:restriction endonuclease subunit S n=1 Tax=Bradyrhizobium oligotrophicum TaxID=44255 RepID=UPI003EBE6C88
MNAERLLAHYEEIAEAPDAIARLRRFILALAVRGKLVAQDPNDEPASELLRRAGVQFAQQVHDGKLNKPKPVTPISTSDYLFDLPGNWRWARFNQIASIQSNLVNPRQYRNMPHIAPDNIESWTARLLPYSTIEESGVFSGKHLFYAGAILYSKIRPNLAKATKVDFDGLCSADMYPIVALIDPDFLLKFMVSEAFVSQAVSEDNRVAMPKINQSALSEIIVPVPPLAEQRRIAAKVNDLMELCDHFEASRTAREATRDRLAAASLVRLNAPDPETFQSDARFALDALPALTTRPDQIKQLRQTILNLAMKGCLTASWRSKNPNHGDGTKIVASLNAAHEQNGGHKRGNAALATEGVHEFDPQDLPESWGLTDLRSAVQPDRPITYGILMPGPDSPGGVPYIRVADFPNDQLNIKTVKRTTKEIEAKYARARLASNDILLSIRGTVGRTCVVPPELEGANITQDTARLSLQESLNKDYVLIVLRAPDTQLRMQKCSKGVAVRGMNIGDVRALQLPLPPRAEQDQIVEKVGFLMSLCDRLDASLAAATEARRRLLEAALVEALLPKIERKREAAE